MSQSDFLRAQAHHFSLADTPWAVARRRNAPLQRPSVEHYWTGEPIEVQPMAARRRRWGSNGFVIYRGPSMFDGKPIICIASGFVDPSLNEKTGPMIQTWVMREDLDPQQAVWTGNDSSICGDCVHRGEIGQSRDRAWIKRRREESVMRPGLTFYEGGVLSDHRRLLPKSEDRSCYVVVSQAPLDKWKQFHRGEFPIVELQDLPGLFRGAFPARIGSYGDPTAVPVEVWKNVLKHQACWTGYTSQWRCEENQGYRDFLMASVSTPADMVDAHKLGWRTFRIGRKNEPLIAGVEIICPATPEGGSRTTCDSCNLCMGLGKSGARSIVTAPHGSGAKYHEARGDEEQRANPRSRRPQIRRVLWGY